jgi:hypothetical protein
MSRDGVVDGAAEGTDSAEADAKVTANIGVTGSDVGRGDDVG